MNRRTLTVNRAPSKRRARFTPPSCESTAPGRDHLRCVLDAGHETKHFADGVSWEDEVAA